MKALDRWLGRLLGVLFLGASVYHVVRVLVPSLRDDDPQRHAAFSLINLAAAIGLFAGSRSRAFAAAFVALFVQQVVSHGGDVWRVWREHGRVEPQGAAVLGIMLVATLLVLRRAFSRETVAEDV